MARRADHVHTAGATQQVVTSGGPDYSQSGRGADASASDISPASRRLLIFELTDFPPAIYDFLTRKPPGLLAHYTGFDALVSMLKTRELWATRHRLLNDVTEVEHAMGVAVAVAAELEGEARRAGDTRRAALCQAVRGDIMDHEHASLNCHILSLSMAADEPGQWRIYTREGDGLCLVFDGAAIADTARSLGGFAAPCVYDSLTQYAMVKSLIERHVAETRQQQQEDDGPDPRQLPRHGWRPLLWLLAAFLKHPDFESEHEWRCVWADNRIGGFAAHSLASTDRGPDHPDRLRPAFVPFPLRQVVLSPRHPYLGLEEQVRSALGAAEVDASVIHSRFKRRPGTVSFPTGR